MIIDCTEPLKWFEEVSELISKAVWQLVSLQSFSNSYCNKYSHNQTYKQSINISQSIYHWFNQF